MYSYGDPVMIMIAADTHEIRVLEDGAIFHSMGHDGNPGCPILQLKDGRRTYGCRCWWGEKPAMEAKLAATHPFAVYKVVEPPEGFADPAPDPSDPNVITDAVPKGQYLQ